MRKRILSFILSIILLFTCIPSSVFAEEEAPVCEIIVDSVSAAPGTMVDVNISVKNNPGILGATFNITWDEGMTLVSSECGEAFAMLNMTKPNNNKSGGNYVWYGTDLADSDITDGAILKLSFEVDENINDGSQLDVGISYVDGDVIDKDLELISPRIENGSVTVVSYLPGDVNGDEKINALDLIWISRYIADGMGTDEDGYNVSLNTSAADVNDDGRINAMDLIWISRYIADGCKTDPNGYNITLKASSPRCSHTMEATEGKPASCTEDGNIAYWYCTRCGKYFEDAGGNQEISREETVIPKQGHTVVIDPAKAPTYTETGLTEGSHCAVCKAVIVPQQIVPVLTKEEYSIQYNVGYNDGYLAGIDFTEQIPESARTYTREDGLYELPLLEAEGYNFIGWFDGASSQAERVTEIPSGTRGNKTLYAHWEIVNYTITFDSSLITVDSIRDHTVNKATSLPGDDIMNLRGYRWLGWTDENGELYSSSYPAGRAGNITLHANWQSYRNQAVPVQELAEPEILEDEATGTYMFTFELGEIKNVPLQVINDFGKMVPGQPVVKEVVTNTVSLEDQKATEIANTVSKSTTKTSTWTLANEWNNVSSISQSHCEEMGIDSSTITYDFASSDSKLSLSEDQGGSSSETVNWGLNAKVYGKNTTEVGAEVKFPVDIFNIGVSAKNTTEIGGELGGHYDKTTVNEAYWNTQLGYETSSSLAHSTTAQESLSQHVSNAYSYNTTHSEGGSESTSEAYAVGESSTDEYSTTVAYTTEEIEAKSYETTYTTDTEGWWRQLIVGTVHVIGVVAYDMETSTYSVFTYNVLDDRTDTYMDFSRTSGDYNDFETGVIPFEVPYSVNEYISYALGYSEGLEIDRETGVITNYSEDAEHVHIPDYYTVSNGDGTYTAVKVTGIAPGVFADKTSIKSVRLGKYVAEIPENAFKGCSALETIEYNEITSIGENAFAGCTSLNKFTVDPEVVSVGAGAFENVPEIIVNAANSNVVKNATVSGAKKISIYLKQLSDELSNTVLAVPEITESYALYGRDSESRVKTYSNVRIDSKAVSTTINGMSFVDNSDVVLKLNSENVTLAEVTVQDAPGFAMILTADHTNLYLMDKSMVSSAGDYVILAHGAALAKAPGTNTATSLTAGRGKFLYCTEFLDDSGLYVGEKEGISEESYQQLLNDSLPWVLESEMPAGATVINQKWTYDLTTNITSDKNYVEGYTLYDTTSAWGNYGAWSGWSSSAAYNSDSRQVETRTVTDRAGYTNYRYWIYRSADHHTYGTQGYNGVCWNYEEINLNYPLTLVDSANGLYGYYNCGHGYSWSNLWFFGESTWIPAVTHTEYRYRDRALVYTYYHTKTEAMESESEIAPSDTVSNVQKWVQYVVK